MKRYPQNQGSKIDSARKFGVSEFLPIPVLKEGPVLQIDRKSLGLFRNQHSDYTDKHGCYIFGIQAGKNTIPTPIYVGCAVKQPLGSEAFTSHKLGKLNRALLHCKRGKPVVAFIVPEDNRLQVRHKSIEEMEQILIQYAHERNPDVQNERGIIKYRWFIDGVFNSKCGHPAEKCNQFRAMLGIK